MKEGYIEQPSNNKEADLQPDQRTQAINEVTPEEKIQEGETESAENPEDMKTNTRKIPEESERYRAHLEESRKENIEDGGPIHVAFGKNILSSLRLYREMSSAPLIAEAEKMLRKSRQVIEKLWEDEKSRPVVLSFLEEILEDKELKKDLKQKLEAGPSFGSHHVAREFKKIPDDIYERMLAAHVTQFEIKSKKFLELEPILRSQSTQLILEEIKAGRIALQPEIAASRISGVTVHLEDALTSKLEENLGTFYPESNQIRIAEQLSPDELQSTYVHEMLHALSGRTITEVQWEDSSSMIAHQRIGTHFSTRQERFRWLNEAITEALAMQLLGRSKSTTYTKERKLLELISKKGNEEIPRELFTNAYFENYEFGEKDKTGQGVPAWKRLQEKMSQAYGPGFLVELDKLIKVAGIQEAIRQFDR